MLTIKPKDRNKRGRIECKEVNQRLAAMQRKEETRPGYLIEPLLLRRQDNNDQSTKIGREWSIADLGIPIGGT